VAAKAAVAVLARAHYLSTADAATLTTLVVAL
jgi:hypothetical protein